MVAHDPYTLNSGSKWNRARKKYERIKDSISSFAPPLFFEESPKERKLEVFYATDAEYDNDFSSLIGSDLYEVSEDDPSLSYLPGKGANLPPKTVDILTRLTRYYVEDSPSSDPKILDLVSAISEAISEEHRFVSVPFSIDGREYTDQLACKIISFAILHRIPYEVVAILWKVSISSSEENDFVESYSQTKQILKNMSSWKSVQLSTTKLPIRIRSKYTTKTFALRRENTEDYIRQASQVIPPRKKPSTEVLLESIEQLSSAVPQSSLFSSFTLRKRFEDLHFFPQRKEWVKRWSIFVDQKKKNLQARKLPGLALKIISTLAKKWSNFMDEQGQKLQTAGRAGLISYGILNAAWYSFAMVLSWKRVSVTTLPGLQSPFRASLWRFSRVSIYVYLGSQLTKIPRLALAVVMAPLGDKMLSWFETKFNVGSNQAFWIATGMLLGLCFSSWIGLILFDAYISSGGSFVM